MKKTDIIVDKHRCWPSVNPASVPAAKKLKPINSNKHYRESKMLAKHVVRLMRYLMMLCVIALASGCASDKVPGDFCAIAQKPFEWRSDAEIDATPIRPLRYIEEGAALYWRQCKHT